MKIKSFFLASALAGLVFGVVPALAAVPTLGGGTKESPAIGPAASFGLGRGYTLVKNWKFGAKGTIKNVGEMNANFFYHDEFGTIGNGTNYGAVMVSPDAGNAIAGQPVEDPAHPARRFFTDSMRTFLVPLHGAQTCSPKEHNVGCGSFMAKWKLPKGGSLLGQDMIWETRVRYVTPPYFWFALWTAGNIWDHGAEMDVIESFGYDNGKDESGKPITNFKGDYWHSGSVGAEDETDYKDWGKTMAAHGIRNYDAAKYHIWTWVYRKDDTYDAYVDGVRIQSGKKFFWTVGCKKNGVPIDMDFLFDATWGHVQIASVNRPLPASAFEGSYYEWDYSRVYLR